LGLNFAFTGCGGYIAPRHLQAIKDVNGQLVAATDPNDSVGILDRFQDVPFFTNFERYSDFIHRNILDRGEKLDYVAVCSPNYLHTSHIASALRMGADAICEKPLVLNKADLDYLQALENKTGKKVYNVLQLRLLPTLIDLKRKIDQEIKDVVDVELSYITRRGPWYLESWKGIESKSGGVATNIGIHFFDLLMWYFGKPLKKEMHLSQPDKMSGYLELEKARVKWFLSVDHNDLPEVAKKAGKPAYRSLTMNGQELEFSEGFTDLHTVLYKDIVAGKGFGIDLARTAIELVDQIRSMPLDSSSKHKHPLLSRR
jgi:UDP-N-acetyl-2-amino-2-deoxyglucuronate dehydrogenase